MAFSVQDWYKKMNEGEILLAYKGDITSTLITNVLEVVESKLDDTKENAKLRKKVYNVLVECLQNLYHHLDQIPTGANGVEADKFAIFIISKTDLNYKISTGNFVKNNKMQMLRDRIEQINSLSTDEIKELYKMILNNREYSDKGGGGLGMIDIAKRTGSKLDYVFHEYDKNYSFFSFSVNID